MPGITRIRGRVRRAVLHVSLIVLFGATAVVAQAQMPTTVYVFNGGADNEGKKGDLFETGAQGWIFTQLGLLDANGKPPVVDGNDLKQGNTVVGTVLRDGNNKIIGYQSADGTKRAYNVDTSATTRQAWDALSSTGTFVVAKHGQNGGGGITLDGGTMYDGFGPLAGGGGTGAGNPAGPYPLPPKQGGMVTFYANGCYTSHDPPGGVGSVTGSAGGIGGVTGTQGNPGIIYKGTGLGLSGPSQAAVDAALEKLAKAAKEAGFTTDSGAGDVAGWIASLPFPTQYSTVEAALAGTGVTAQLSYTKTATCNGGGGGASGCYYVPLEVMDLQGGSLVYQAEPGFPLLELTVPPGALFGPPSPVQLMPVPPLEALLPPGLRPSSYAASVARYGLDPLLQIDPTLPALLRLQPDPFRPLGGVFELLPNGQLLPVPFAPGTGNTVEVQVDHSGVWLALEAPLGQYYCPANPNSTGQPAQIVATGSPFTFRNDLFLTAHSMPPNAFGFFLSSQGQIFVANPGGSQGKLCIGPAIGRGVGGEIFNSGPQGEASVVADLQAMPLPTGPVAVLPGDTWYLQAWFRDAVGGSATSNLTDAVQLTFQ